MNQTRNDQLIGQVLSYLKTFFESKTSTLMTFKAKVKNPEIQRKKKLFFVFICGVNIV